MRGDLRIRPQRVRLSQRLQRFVRLAEAKLHPAKTIEYEGISGRQRYCLLDQFVGLAIALSTVCKRVPEGIVSMCMVRFEFDDTPQVALEFIDTVELFRHHCTVVNHFD